MYQLIDFISRKPVTAKGFIFTGENSPWEVQMDMAAVKAKLNLDYFKTEPPGLSKYLPLMPIKNYAEFVALHETATPLVRSKTLGKQLGLDLYFKIEGKNPTGSFKDRGSAMDVSVAKELGAKSIILASTGNMAASCACYAAAAKIPCFVLVPEGTAVAKLAQVIAFGGRIIQIKGSYNDAANLAKIVADKMGFYLAGDYAYRVEGQKTAAFEIIDQLFFQAPELVVVPIGCGTNIAAYAKGFREYQALGLLNKIPQLMGVEATGAAAVVEACQKKLKNIIPFASANTFASAIAVPDPIDGIKALDAIYSTQGMGVAVTDQEILRAQYLLSTEEGLFVETASASTIAALTKSIEENKLTQKKVICILTGDGLKDSNIILKAAIKPPTIYPDEKEFMLLYDNHFFNSKSMIFVDKNKMLFNHEPNAKEIKEQLKNLLNADYSDEYVARIQSNLSQILQKVPVITISDFQDAVQDALETPRDKGKQKFSVLDFEVITGKHRKPHATVKIKIAEETREASAEGTGPVDAVIKALCDACQEKIAFKLLDYKVEIRSPSAEAVVYVEIKLVKDHTFSSGSGSSSDIIQASIKAFQDAYNGF